MKKIVFDFYPQVLITRVLCSVFVLHLAATPVASEQSPVARHFKHAVEHRIEQPERLQQFLRSLPKGGDLHHHMSGAIYAEDLISIAASSGFWVNTANGALCKNSSSGQCKPNNALPLAQLIANPSFVDWLVERWSTHHFVASPERSAHQHFFSIFGLILPGIIGIEGAIVARLRNAAAEENILYLETQIRPATQQAQAITLGSEIGWQPELAVFYRKLQQRGIMELAEKGSAVIDAFHNNSEAILGCGTLNAHIGCTVLVRYQQYSVRVLSKEQVFAQLVLAFTVAANNPLVLGVNLVAPEDAPLALSDYGLHMQMIAFLREKFPQVQISLHAGEMLADFNQVQAKDLNFHIRQAVEVAHATRIGHGVAILTENRSAQLLAQMATLGVAVEINLASNAYILGLNVKDHPLRHYENAGVPIVISTDDPGIFRSDLSDQFALAIKSLPGLGYGDVKRWVRNSIEYSFLSGASLWAIKGDYSRVIAACSHKHDSDLSNNSGMPIGCVAHMGKSEKMLVQWQLEGALTKFERGFIE